MTKSDFTWYLGLYLVIAGLLWLTGCGKAAGPQGVQGVAGLMGQPGAPGVGMTLVELCPPTPNTTAQYAECIQNKLFGTYYDKDKGYAFWVELSPGKYKTDGPNPVQFTVAPRCVVTCE